MYVFILSYLVLADYIQTPARLSTRQIFALLAFSILYTINIAISNLSLQLVTVPVYPSPNLQNIADSLLVRPQIHQVVRATSPLFTMFLAYILTGTSISLPKLLSLLPIVFGVVIATYGDYYFTLWGLILTLFGTLLAALKTVITNILQSGSRRRLTISNPSSSTKAHQPLKLHPLDLLGRMSPLAFIQCVIYGWLNGELEGVRKYGATKIDKACLTALFVNGVIAFGLNVVSFTANKKSGPLAISVAGRSHFSSLVVIDH